MPGAVKVAVVVRESLAAGAVVISGVYAYPDDVLESLLGLIRADRDLPFTAAGMARAVCASLLAYYYGDVQLAESSGIGLGISPEVPPGITHVVTIETSTAAVVLDVSDDREGVRASYGFEHVRSMSELKWPVLGATP